MLVKSFLILIRELFIFMNDKVLADKLLGCPSYKRMDNSKTIFNELSEILVPIFNKFQLEKSENNLNFFLRHMKAMLNGFLNSKEFKEREYYKTFVIKAVENYYKLFKGVFYERYKVLSFSTPYNTDVIPLKHNIDGMVDLIIKTSYGITLVNYVFYSKNFLYFHNLHHNATRLQIAGRCLKLISDITPDLLCIIVFTKNNIFKRYFKFLDEPYELHVEVLENDLIPVKKTYNILCSTCQETHCSPWKIKEKVLI